MKLSLLRLFKQDTKKKFNPKSNQIFKLVKNFDACGTCKDQRAMGFLPSGLLITQERCGHFVDNFAYCI